MVLMPNNEQWRVQRKLMHQVLNLRQSVFRPLQDLESKALLSHILQDPQKWYLSLARFTSSVILNVVFGIRTEMGDENFTTIFKAQESFVPYTMPGYAKVDSLPFLTEVPYLKRLQPWRWAADKVYKDTLRQVPGSHCPFNDVESTGEDHMSLRLRNHSAASKDFLMSWTQESKPALKRIVS